MSNHVAAAPLATKSYSSLIDARTAAPNATEVRAFVMALEEAGMGPLIRDWDLSLEFRCGPDCIANFDWLGAETISEAAWRALTGEAVAQELRVDPCGEVELAAGGSGAIMGALGTDGCLAEVYFTANGAHGITVATFVVSAAAVAGPVSAALKEARAQGLAIGNKREPA